MGNTFRSLTWASWKAFDTMDSKHFTIFTAFILKPSWEYPIPSAAMTIKRGTKKILLRMSYKALRELFNVPEKYRERLDYAFRQSLSQSQDIIDQQKAYHKMSKLQLEPGAMIVRTDTGEIIAEAERIIKEHEHGEQEASS